MTRIPLIRLAVAAPLLAALAFAQDHRRVGEGGASAKAAVPAANPAGIVDLYTRQMPLTILVLVVSLVWLWAVATFVYSMSMDRSGPAKAAKNGWTAGPLLWLLFLVGAHFLIFARHSGA